MVRSHNSIRDFFFPKLTRLFTRFLRRNFFVAESHACHQVRIRVRGFFG